MAHPQFYRKALHLRPIDPQRAPKTPQQPPSIGPRSLEQRVLVINGSTQMASAITKQLLVALPNASIMYAPTIELAGWILKSRSINLIVSSDILPDGGSHKLYSIMKQLQNPPDVLMVGNSIRSSVQQLRKAGYRLISRKTIPKPSPRPEKEQPSHRTIDEKVSTLSADLRNDLNNPLQEIVTMAFVARQSKEQKELSLDALHAIEQAAKQLAGTVSGIEERIKAVL